MNSIKALFALMTRQCPLQRSNPKPLSVPVLVLCCLLAWGAPAVAVEYNNGWSETANVVDEQYAWDAEVHKLGNGTYRMFYEQHDQSKILTRTSSNGTNWSAASETGLSGVAMPGAVRVADDNWVMIYQEGGSFKRATSSDGVTFTPQSGTILDPIPADAYEDSIRHPSILALPGGGYRLFYGGEGASGNLTILSASSSDLITWTRDPGRRLELSGSVGGVMSPCAVVTSDNYYRLFCMGPDLWSDGTPNSGIVMATSPDGLNFTLRSGPEINGGDESGQTYYPEDPSVLVDGAGWSLYFSKYLTAGGVGDNTAVYLAQKTFIKSLSGLCLDSESQPVAGVVVELAQGEDNVVASTASDAQGYYEFSNLPAGDYEIDSGEGYLITSDNTDFSSYNGADEVVRDLVVGPEPAAGAGLNLLLRD